MNAKRSWLLLWSAVVLLLIVPRFGFADAPDLIVLHTNDLHGRIESSDELWGMPRIGTLVQSQRETYQRVLVLDAGDALHGTPVTNQLQGSSAVEAMNAAGYDVMVPGNHDFNFGYERLLELEQTMQFRLVAANVRKNGELLFAPYTIKDLDGVRIGIFGLATPDTYSTTHPRNIDGIEFSDMISAAQESVAALQRENVDLIIALGHVGLGQSHPSTALVDAVDGIHLFVDGHSHDLLPTGKRHRDTLLVQANEYGKYVGRVEVRFRDGRPELTASVISARKAADVEPDAAIEEMLIEFRAEVRRQLLGI